MKYNINTIKIIQRCVPWKSRKLKLAATFFILSIISIMFNSCKKAVEIASPVSTITTSQIFADDANANAAVLGIYSTLANTYSPSIGSGAITLCAGLSSDELTYYLSNSVYLQFGTNSLQSNNSILYSQLWQPAYFAIYQSNAVIAGLLNSAGVHDSIRNQLSGEAKFIRAYLYFYLVNMFGDVPLVLTTDYNKTVLMTRTPQIKIYEQIIEDLTDAQNNLPTDYTISNGERIRANKWAATALLARVYLYQQKWSDAEASATTVINNTSIYNLEDSLNNVFLLNSKETILQFQPNQSFSGNYATVEGSFINPIFAGFYAPYDISTNLLNAFENGDMRKTKWVNSTQFGGSTNYYPYKYKVGSDGYTGPYTEYYMVLRLAELHLIRAEALAQQNSNLAIAISDLNLIRKRAGLPELPTNLAQSSLIDAVAQERRIELFAEWGHRWFDLKRTGKAASLLSINKGIIINSDELLYPIPVTEITADPNLTQNVGY